MRAGKMKLKSNLQMRNLCFMNNKIESERDGMKKGINIKNVIVSLVFFNHWDWDVTICIICGSSGNDT